MERKKIFYRVRKRKMKVIKNRGRSELSPNWTDFTFRKNIERSDFYCGLKTKTL